MDWQLAANRNGHVACTHGGETLAGLMAARDRGMVDAGRHRRPRLHRPCPQVLRVSGHVLRKPVSGRVRDHPEPGPRSTGRSTSSPRTSAGCRLPATP
ncbi:MAG: hypothetical protein MZV70_45950 [Desulfobacterales bacterium]|nr:hypothetical protein [Desulfobacterales bacterium]